MKSCHGILFGCALIAALCAPATRAAAVPPAPKVSLHADREHVKVAEPIWVTFTATAPRGWTIQLPELPEQFGELKVIEVERHSDPDQKRPQTVVVRLMLESLLPGRYTVGPFQVRFVPTEATARSDSGSEADVVQRSTGTVAIDVHSSLGFFESRRQLREIHGTVFVPWTWWQWTIAVAGTLAALGLGRVVHQWIGRWWRSRRLSQSALLEQLDRLDEARLNRSLSSEAVITGVADIVRQSLRLAEGANAVYRTSSEWMERVHQPDAFRETSSRVGREKLADAIQVALREADAVKFAGTAAGLDQTRRSLAAGRTVVRTFLGEAASGSDGAAR